MSDWVTKETMEERAEKMRLNPTFYEKVFAKRLTLHRIKFETQKVIGWYIADFVIGQNIFEIDGKSHIGIENEEYDKKRDTYLRELGYKVFRLKNGSGVTDYSLDWLEGYESYNVYKIQLYNPKKQAYKKKEKSKLKKKKNKNGKPLVTKKEAKKNFKEYFNPNKNPSYQAQSFKKVKLTTYQKAIAKFNKV